MRRPENLLIGFVWMVVMVLAEAGAKHLTSPDQQSIRHVRAIEPSQQETGPTSAQQQQQQQQVESQQPISLFGGRSSDGTFLEETTSSETSRPSSRFLSTLPLDKLRYLLLPTTHDSSPRSERFLLPGMVNQFGHPRTGRADSNFIRFGRSSPFSGVSGASIKKNNFIRLGRENPRQNNFIRLGRAGQWDSSERFLVPKVGFFPDNYYYSTPSHWSRPSDLVNLSQGIPTYDDGLDGGETSSSLFRQSG